MTLNKNSINKALMKKHCLLLAILSLINFSTHIHGMKKEIQSTDHMNLSTLLTPRNTIFDHIASFLPFHDYETEEEFIERTRSLTIKTVPEEYACKHISQSNIKYAAYSSDNTKIIISEKPQQSDLELMSTTVMPKLIIITSRHLLQHKECCIGNTHQHLAISRNGERFATIYSDAELDMATRRTINKYSLIVTRFNCDENINHDIPLSFELSDQHPTIAFNKQGTRIIVHDKNSQHIIFPTSNITHNENIHKKTLTLEKYFQQRGICKKLFEQLRKQKKNSLETTT
jgi:hypothetical protein